MRFLLGIICMTLASLATCGEALAQSEPEPVWEVMVRGLRASDRNTREAAAYHVADVARGNSDLLALVPALREAIIDVLVDANVERDRRYIVNESGEDGFSEYYSVLLDLSVRVLDFEPVGHVRVRAIGALASSSYNPDSALERRLASLGDEVCADIEGLSRSENAFRREAGMSLARQIAVLARKSDRRSQSRISARNAFALRTMVRRGLEDEDVVVRRASIKAAIDMRLVEALPVLERMEQQDADAASSYSVRQLARKARIEIGNASVVRPK